MPTATLPKLTLDGDTPICPGAAPVPESATDRVGLEAFELIVSFPVTDPPDSGLKPTLNVALCPALKVAGGLIPLKLKPVPVVTICEIVMAVDPTFVTVSEAVLLMDVCTVPKLMLPGFATSEPEDVVAVPVSGTIRDVNTQLPCFKYL